MSATGWYVIEEVTLAGEGVWFTTSTQARGVIHAVNDRIIRGARRVLVTRVEPDGTRRPAATHDGLRWMDVTGFAPRLRDMLIEQGEI